MSYKYENGIYIEGEPPKRIIWYYQDRYYPFLLDKLHEQQGGVSYQTPHYEGIKEFRLDITPEILERFEAALLSDIEKLKTFELLDYESDMPIFISANIQALIDMKKEMAQGHQLFYIGYDYS